MKQEPGNAVEVEQAVPNWDVEAELESDQVKAGGKKVAEGVRSVD